MWYVISTTIGRRNLGMASEQAFEIRHSEPCPNAP